MGPVLDSRGSLFPSNITQGLNGALRGALAGDNAAFPPSSLELGAVVECSCPTCYKCPFLPLFGSLLHFPLLILAGLSFCFPLLTAYCSLYSFVNSLQSSFLLSVSLWLSIPRNISALTELMGNLGRVSLVGHEKRCRRRKDAGEGKMLEKRIGQRYVGAGETEVLEKRKGWRI